MAGGAPRAARDHARGDGARVATTECAQPAILSRDDGALSARGRTRRDPARQGQHRVGARARRHPSWMAADLEDAARRHAAARPGSAGAARTAGTRVHLSPPRADARTTPRTGDLMTRTFRTTAVVLAALVGACSTEKKASADSTATATAVGVTPRDSAAAVVATDAATTGSIATG